MKTGKIADYHIELDIEVNKEISNFFALSQTELIVTSNQSDS